MTGFSAEWLALREPADRAARNLDIEAAFIAALPQDGPVRLVDLASGTGATVRALTERLPRPQVWVLTDDDPTLLAEARRNADATMPASVTVEERRIDLSADLARLEFDGFHGVTTSAFLDLVSRRFLDTLADRLAAAHVPVLASLTYDGRVACTPAHPVDEPVRRAVNAHQKGNKGFGPALGRDAAGTCSGILAARGFTVRTGPSDWLIGPEEHAFQDQLVRGWFAAAREMMSKVELDAAALDDWLAFRLDAIGRGRSTICVGHIDLAAVPV
ncbi:group 1 glycosyl transferase [Polymorphum gilvum]|uniref:Glycosyl transferase, group 1, putative n=1 Tax=Polymorphum gilvum (strain LMG 25793 / CGMCC 1.9160 / SL003B-26A1) TaxID=991905 RepID=F2J5H5_POLGS|nr:group 1 glycosyl transferase [Polymorphum gilvum]ADZ72345.1 Glycosyl transferase, group 1, putative [Polymorphum gilvum SL003B-26A1]